jgi:hypothetical protein
VTIPPAILDLLPGSALWGILLSIALWLDAKLKPTIKQRLLGDLAVKDAPSDLIVSRRLEYFYTLLTIIFPTASLSKYVWRCAVATLLLLVAILLLQYTLAPLQFNRVSLAFLNRAITEFRAFFILLGFFVVDMVSVYMTILFVRLGKNCRNVGEFLFVAMADIATTFVIFMLVFPLFVTTAFLVRQNEQTHVRFVLTGSPTNQNTILSSTAADILVIRPPTPSGVNEDLGQFAQTSGWYFEVYQVFIGESADQQQTAKDVVAQKQSISPLIFQIRNDTDADDVYGSLNSMLSETEYVSSATLVKSESGALGSSYGLYDIVSTYSLGFDEFGSTYFDIMKRINFFDQNIFASAFSLRSSVFDENDAYYALSENRQLHAPRTVRGLLMCDGKVQRRVDVMILSPNQAPDCVKGVAISEWQLIKIAATALYKSHNSIKIPILPFALTSLIATILFYALVIISLVAWSIRGVISYTVSDGEAFFVKHVFVFTTLAILGLFLCVTWVYHHAF